MNLNDVQSFIDLVKNPDKYEAALKQFEEREAYWTSLVEAHTKLQEVDKYVASKEIEANTKLDKAAQTLMEAEMSKAQSMAHVSDMVAIAEKSKAEQVKAEATAKQLANDNAQVLKESELLKKQWEKDSKLVADRLASLLEKEKVLDDKLKALKAITA
jgi:cysteinyl-tRNA synthetase